jgi:hypothetical protein
LCGKHTLDNASGFSFGVVGPLGRPGYRVPLRLLAVNAAGEAALAHERLIRKPDEAETAVYRVWF